MKISIIIVNYNGETYLADCLTSILNSNTKHDYEIIIVDNQSTDGSVAVLEQFKSSCKIILNHNNSGFSKANNIGVANATGDYFFFLNNDTVLPTDTLAQLPALLSEQANVDVIVPKLLNADQSLQAPGGLFARSQFKSSTPRKISFAAGAAILISRKAYTATGGFDNSYFFYNEDVDLCKSLLKQGYPIYYDPRVSVTHFGGLATSFRKYHSIIEGYRGGFYLCKKFYGPIALQLYRLLMLIYTILKLASLLPLLAFNEQYQQTLKAYVKVLHLNLKQDFQFKHPAENVTVLT